jgi:hypothetical protein
MNFVGTHKNTCYVSHRISIKVLDLEKITSVVTHIMYMSLKVLSELMHSLCYLMSVDLQCITYTYTPDRLYAEVKCIFIATPLEMLAHSCFTYPMIETS